MIKLNPPNTRTNMKFLQTRSRRAPIQPAAPGGHALLEAIIQAKTPSPFTPVNQPEPPTQTEPMKTQTDAQALTRTPTPEPPPPRPILVKIIVPTDPASLQANGKPVDVGWISDTLMPLAYARGDDIEIGTVMQS